MTDLPIPLLRTFVVVAETLNLTTAASRLHRAPSTISMQVNRLESLVTAPLLERGQYGVRLTVAGEQLKSHAQQLLALHDRILGGFQNADITGKVRLGTHDLYITRALTPLLESYGVSYPEAELEVTCDHRPGYLASLVADGRLDLALVEMPTLSDGGVRLSRDRLVWVRGEAHPLNTQETIPLAVFPDGCFYRESATKALQRIDAPYRITFTSHSRAGVLAAVRAGIGIGVCPESALEPGLVVIDDALPALPQTDTTLFIADKVNAATARLAQTIEESPLFRHADLIRH
ncbi:LysR family transcriptional regulator [Marinobacterium zhoushanense]|uniref:LysR family transcriptional regulator n=1 Tax=Marinobacterium zhoushanense TaxID=1679163 RepID=A0ABQ1KCS3_9GAMM|nr:LysR family transcriptional regulator [Marinobacterium zhoushanense]GGB91863.1 LysR family transcriptional regulator [Marinobacterium zhoushanense]